MSCVQDKEWNHIQRRGINLHTGHEVMPYLTFYSCYMGIVTTLTQTSLRGICMGESYSFCLTKNLKPRATPICFLTQNHELKLL